MRILWLSHLIPYPPKGGVLQRSFNMVKEISKYHSITLIAFNQAGFLESSLPEVQDPVSHASEELKKYVDSIEIYDIPENKTPAGRYWIALKAFVKGESYNMEWLKSDEYRECIKKFLDSNTFDVIHVDSISLCVFFDVFQDIPVVLNHHNFESKMLLDRSKTEKNVIKKIYYNIEGNRLLKSEKKYCTKSQLNITCSDEDSFAMKEELKINNFLSVPNAVDCSYFFPNPSVQPVKNRIVIVGGLSWYPNRDAVEYFIREIWPLLKMQVPTVEVDIIGRSPTEEMLELAETDDHFRVHGFVDDVRKFLWESEIYLCPIRIGGGTKLKILDALATGCCIVSHPFACKGIKVKEGDHALYAVTPEDFVDKIKYVMNNPELQEKLRSEGPELIRRQYSYDSIGKNYSESLIKLAHRERTNVHGRYVLDSH